MANNIKVTFYDDVRIQQNINETNMALPANGGVFSDGGIYFTPAEEIAGANVPAHIVHKNYIYTLGSYVTTQTDTKGITLTTDKTFDVVTNVEAKPYNRELIVTKTPLVIDDKWTANINALTNKMNKLADGKLHSVQIGSDIIYLLIDENGTLTFTSDTTVVKVESIDIPKSIELYGEDATATLTATINPASATNKDINWKSSNANVSLTNETTNTITVVSKKIGNSTVTVSATDGSGVKNSCDVTVKEARITSIKADNITTTYGTTSKIYVKPYVTINNGDGKLFTYTFSYNVTNGAYCSINSTGYLGIFKPGETTATVTANADESKSYTFNVKINKADNEITVKDGDNVISGTVTKVYSPNAFYLTATAKGDGNTFTWNTSNSNVAEIGSDGKFTMNTAGNVTITVNTDGNTYYGAASKDIQFKINKANSPITIDPEMIEFELGSTETKTFNIENGLERNLFTEIEYVNSNNSYVNFSKIYYNVFGVTLKHGATAADLVEFDITADENDKYLGSTAKLKISIKEPTTPPSSEPTTNYYWYVNNFEDIVKGDLAAGDIDWSKAQQVTSFDELNYSTDGTKITMVNSGNNSVYILCPKSWSNKWQFWNVDNDIDLTTGFQEVGAILEKTFIKDGVEYDLWWFDGYYGNTAHMRKI